ncbi:WD40 repeat domain-containing protein [Streptomyces sp. NPDC053780]|uniref:WD40 repeat domain-containing protein n=1 Tax=unclassified Streptomyces TaxID=2593676 RepID=UPI00341F7EBA
MVITKTVEQLDCREVAPFMTQEECERFNAEEAGVHVIGHELPDMIVGVLDGRSGDVLWQRGDPESACHHVRFSPDGTLLAVAGEGLQVLDAAEGLPRVQLGSLSATGLPPVFSADSKRLVAAGSAGLVLIDVVTGQPEWTRALPEGVAQIAFVDGDSVLIAATERQVFWIDADDGTILTTVELEDPVLGVFASGLSAEGRHLVRVRPGTLTLWDVADGSRRFETTVGNPAEVRLNPVLPELAVTSSTGVKVVNAWLGTTVWEQTGEPLRSLAFTADGRRLAVGGGTGQTGFVRVHDMNPTPVASRTLTGPVKRIAIGSAPDPLAVAACLDPEARMSVFHAKSGAPVLEKVQPGVIAGLELSPDGSHFATAGSDGGVRLFTALTGERVWLVTHNARLNALAFLPSGREDDPSGAEDAVVTACDDKTTRRLIRGTGAEKWKFSHPQAVTRVAASPDGRFVATACLDRSTRLLNADTGKLLFGFPHDARIRAIAFSPDSSILATGGDDGAVLIIDTATGRERGRSVHSREVTAVGLSHDGKLLATAGKDKIVHLFDVAVDPPVKVRTLSFPQPATRLVFHPTDPQLALVSETPHEVTIIDPRDGAELGRLAHPGAVNDLAYSPDGELLATACEDLLARIYPGRRDA